MKRLAGIAFALGAWPALAQSGPSASAISVKPLVEAWRACALEKGIVFMRSGEPAETVAKAALYECRDEKRIVGEAMFRDKHPAGVIVSVMEQIENGIKDLMISAIVQARAK